MPYVLSRHEAHFRKICRFKLRYSLKHAVLAQMEQEKGRKTAIFKALRQIVSLHLTQPIIWDPGKAKATRVGASARCENEEVVLP